jgi:hypothetical protein
MNYSLLCHLDTLLINHTVVHFQKIQINRNILVSFYVARDLGWFKKKNLLYYYRIRVRAVVKSGKLVHIDLIIIYYHCKMLRGYIPPVQYHIKCDNLQLPVQYPCEINHSSEHRRLHLCNTNNFSSFEVFPH